MSKVHCRRMEALDAQFQMRKSKEPATCQLATGLTGENGASVLVKFVRVLAPILGLVIVFLR